MVGSHGGRWEFTSKGQSRSLAAMYNYEGAHLGVHKQR
jgi:hypothetical protein